MTRVIYHSQGRRAWKRLDSTETRPQRGRGGGRERGREGERERERERERVMGWTRKQMDSFSLNTRREKKTHIVNHDVIQTHTHTHISNTLQLIHTDTSTHLVDKIDFFLFLPQVSICILPSFSPPSLPSPFLSLSLSLRLSLPMSLSLSLRLSLPMSLALSRSLSTPLLCPQPLHLSS